MRLNKRYRVTLEDESSLEKRINFSAPLTGLFLILLGVAIVAGAFGMFILASTPMKNYLPGYLKESERTATEEQHLRLDSLARVYEINEAYITGILSALNPSEEKLGKDSINRKPMPLDLDSLVPASEVEREFMERIRQQEKYNISIVPQAVAQTMLFGNVNPSAIITEDSKEKYQADIILPVGGSVSAIADGKVISVATSAKSSGGYEVLIQHPNGFLSKSSRLNNLFVQPGDRVTAGQIIASGTVASGMKGNHMVFELWHDGDPLLPASYLGTSHN